MHLSLNENEFVRFISDLHLTPEKRRLETFYHFLTSLPKSCRCLIILGDFFDYWLGSDMHQNDYNQLMTHLKNVPCPIFFLPGNRDFLIEDDWLKQANLNKLEDPIKIIINNQNILLTHGDQFCTHDHFYQFYRRISRKNIVKNIFLKLPKRVRKFILKGIRISKNKKALARKYAINHNSVKRISQIFDTNMIIHGHIHRPGIHINDEIKRVVLDEWMPEEDQKPSISYLDINNMNVLTLVKRS